LLAQPWSRWPISFLLPPPSRWCEPSHACLPFHGQVGPPATVRLYCPRPAENPRAQFFEAAPGSVPSALRPRCASPHGARSGPPRFRRAEIADRVPRPEAFLRGAPRPGLSPAPGAAPPLELRPNPFCTQINAAGRSTRRAHATGFTTFFFSFSGAPAANDCPPPPDAPNPVPPGPGRISLDGVPPPTLPHLVNHFCRCRSRLLRNEAGRAPPGGPDPLGICPEELASPPSTAGPWAFRPTNGRALPVFPARTFVETIETPLLPGKMAGRVPARSEREKSIGPTKERGPDRLLEMGPLCPPWRGPRRRRSVFFVFPRGTNALLSPPMGNGWRGP